MRETRSKRAARILSALLQHQAGVPVYTVMLNHGISEATLFEWQQRYQNMNMEQLEHVCRLEDENAVLQQRLHSLAGNAAHAGGLDAQLPAPESWLPA